MSIIALSYVPFMHNLHGTCPFGAGQEQSRIHYTSPEAVEGLDECAQWQQAEPTCYTHSDYRPLPSNCNSLWQTGSGRSQTYLVVPQEALPWTAELQIPPSLLGVVPKPAEACQQAVWGWQIPISTMLPHSRLSRVHRTCRDGRWRLCCGWSQDDVCICALESKGADAAGRALLMVHRGVLPLNGDSCTT